MRHMSHDVMIKETPFPFSNCKIVFLWLKCISFKYLRWEKIRLSEVNQSMGPVSLMRLT